MNKDIVDQHMQGISRRSVIAGILLTALAAPALAGASKMSVADAHAAATRGDILLLDIRTRHEWRQTGIGQSAHAVSMHERDFLQKLDALTAGDKSRPVALICAVGRRSQSLQEVLSRMGYSQIIDVTEGMVGGVNGKGWIKSGLPMKAYRP